MIFASSELGSQNVTYSINDPGISHFDAVTNPEISGRRRDWIFLLMFDLLLLFVFWKNLRYTIFFRKVLRNLVG